MALYDYKCNTCGKTFEYRQSMKDDALALCPESICECDEKGKGQVQRVISSNVGLVFKGSGFYLTDYKNNNSDNSSNEKSNTKTETKSKETKTKSKSATTKSDAA